MVHSEDIAIEYRFLGAFKMITGIGELSAVVHAFLYTVICTVPFQIWNLESLLV